MGPAAVIEDPAADADQAAAEVAEAADNISESEVNIMKQASTIIAVIIAIAVLLAAFAVGLGIKRVRVRRANNEPQEVAKPEPKQTERDALPGGGARPRTAGLTLEQRGQRQDERAGMNERWDNMSDEERREFMANRPGRPDAGGRRGDRRRPQGQELSEEERQAMRERFENMSEEEREKFREEMRQRFGGRQPGGRGAPPGISPGERAGRVREAEPRMRENQENVPEN